MIPSRNTEVLCKAVRRAEDSGGICVIYGGNSNDVGRLHRDVCRLLNKAGTRYKANLSEKYIQVFNGKILFKALDNPMSLVGYESHSAYIIEDELINNPAYARLVPGILARNRQVLP